MKPGDRVRLKTGYPWALAGELPAIGTVTKIADLWGHPIAYVRLDRPEDGVKTRSMPVAELEVV